MAGNARINSIIDRESTQKEILELVDGLKNIDSLIKGMPAVILNIKNATSASDIKKASTDATQANKEMAASVDVVSKAIDKLNASASEEGQRLTEVRVQQAAVNKSNKDAAMQALGLVDAYGQLQKQYEAANRSAKNLAATFGENDQRTKDAVAVAQSLDTKLKSIDASVGQYQRNVGNYTGAIGILEKSLKDITAQINKFTTAGHENDAELEQLRREQGLLEVLVSQQSKGFASLTSEIRNNERALATMFEQGLQNTEAFKQIQQAIANAKREVGEFNEQQKIISSQTPVISSLTLAAKGLAGAYAVGAGVSALFADGNEKIEKELNKLVAVMTVLQGLNEAHELLEKKGTIGTILRANAQKVWNFILTGSTTLKKADTVATEAQTVATEEQIVVTKVATGAQEAQAAGTAIQTAAQEGLTVATTATSAAMVALRFALIATGIGALIVLLPTIVNAMSSFGQKTKDAADSQKELAESLEATNEIFSKQLDFINEEGDQKVKILERQISLAEKSGASDEKLFTLRKQLYTEQKKISDELIAKGIEQAEHEDVNVSNGISGMKALKTALSIYASSRISDNNKIKNSEADLNAAKLKGDEDAIKRAQKQLDADKADQSTDEAKYRTYKSILDKQAELDQGYAELTAEYNKSTNDKRKEQLAKMLKDSYELQKAYTEQAAQLFKHVADNEKNSADIRSEASINYYNLQKKLIEDEADFEIASQKLKGKALDIVRVNELTRIFDIERQKIVALEQLQKDASDKYIEGLQQRAEKERIIQEGIDKANAERIKDEVDTLKSGGELMARVRETYYIDEQALLTRQFSTGKIGREEYEKQLLDIQKKYAAKSLAESIRIANAQLALLSPGGKDYDVLANNIAKATLSLNQLGYSFNKTTGEAEKMGKSLSGDDGLKSLAKKLEQAKEIVSDLSTTLESINDIGYEKQSANLESLENEQQKNYEAEQQRIQNSALSEEDKANRLKVLESERNAQKEINDRKQRKLEAEKAKFDRDISIANIILNTAQAVVAALASVPPNVPLSIAIGITGAAALAKAIATPIPKYARGAGIPGRPAHPGGNALIGEGGQPELVQLPSGQSFIASKPIIADLPKFTKVTPFDQLDDQLYHSMVTGHLNMIQDIEKFNKAKDDEAWSIAQWQTGQIMKAYSRNSNRPIVKINVHNNADFKMWVDKNIYHRKGN